MEVEEENSAMLQEIEYLQAENEELQRQLAVFTTEADITT
jgi:cell division septum initiation protein DivIVA